MGKDDILQMPNTNIEMMRNAMSFWLKIIPVAIHDIINILNCSFQNQVFSFRGPFVCVILQLYNVYYSISVTLFPNRKKFAEKHYKNTK